MDVDLVVTDEFYLEDEVIVDSLALFVWLIVLNFRVEVQVPSLVILIVHLRNDFCFVVEGIEYTQHVPQFENLAHQTDECFLLFFVEDVFHLFYGELACELCYQFHVGQVLTAFHVEITVSVVFLV